MAATKKAVKKVVKKKAETVTIPENIRNQITTAFNNAIKGYTPANANKPEVYYEFDGDELGSLKQIHRVVTVDFGRDFTPDSYKDKAILTEDVVKNLASRTKVGYIVIPDYRYKKNQKLNLDDDYHVWTAAEVRRYLKVTVEDDSPINYPLSLEWKDNPSRFRISFGPNRISVNCQHHDLDWWKKSGSALIRINVGTIKKALTPHKPDIHDCNCQFCYRKGTDLNRPDTNGNNATTLYFAMLVLIELIEKWTKTLKVKPVDINTVKKQAQAKLKADLDKILV